MECCYASDQTLLVSFGTEIRLEVNEQVRRLLRVLEEERIPGVVNLHPAYCSVLIRFDPWAFSHRELERVLRARLAEAANVFLPAPRLVEIPVCYGGEFGPDLQGVAQMHAFPSNRS
jgi:inhibitor of KinA